MDRHDVGVIEIVLLELQRAVVDSMNHMRSLRKIVFTAGYNHVIMKMSLEPRNLRTLTVTLFSGAHAQVSRLLQADFAFAEELYPRWPAQRPSSVGQLRKPSSRNFSHTRRTSAAVAAAAQ